MFAGLTGQSESVCNIPRTVITEYDKHYNTLVAMANEHKFIIHDVVGDGDCLFNPICYQLKIDTAIDGALLRVLTVVYLAQNPCIDGVHKGEFLCDDIIPGNTTVLSPQVKWESYLQQLMDGAWGDQISVQAISNLFKIKVDILATIGTNVVVVSPTDGSCCEYTVNVGLIMQNHYVGLDVCESMSNADTHDSSVTDNTSDEPMYQMILVMSLV